MEKLLEISAEICGAVHKAQAAVGVSQELPAKHAADDFAAVLAKVPGIGLPPKPESEHDMMYRRRSKKADVADLLDAASIDSLFEATRTRFAEGSDNATSEIEVPVIGASLAKSLRTKWLATRRKADKHDAQLRLLNALNNVYISDETMDWLVAAEVI